MVEGVDPDEYAEQERQGYYAEMDAADQRRIADLLGRVLKASPLIELPEGSEAYCVHCDSSATDGWWGDPAVFEEYHVVHVHEPDCPWMEACRLLGVGLVRPGEEHRLGN